MKSYRIVYICTALDDIDYSEFPSLKAKQVAQAVQSRDDVDVKMLAFGTKYIYQSVAQDRIEDPAFEIRHNVRGAPIGRSERDIDTATEYPSFDMQLFVDFVRQWHIPGRTILVFGMHGLGECLDLYYVTNYTEDDGVTPVVYNPKGTELLHVATIAEIFCDLRFEAVIFDACLMSTVDCAAALHVVTPYVGACEGFMWEEDTDIELHVFNSDSIKMLCCRSEDSILERMLAVQRRFIAHSHRGDFTITSTRYAHDLCHYLNWTKVIRDGQETYGVYVLYEALKRQHHASVSQLAIDQDPSSPEIKCFLLDIQFMLNAAPFAPPNVDKAAFDEFVSKSTVMLGDAIIAHRGPRVHGQKLRCTEFCGLSFVCREIADTQYILPDTEECVEGDAPKTLPRSRSSELAAGK